MAVHAEQRQRHITPNTTEEIKLDGYRAVAFKSGGKVHLRSRNDNDFAVRYAAIAKALQAMTRRNGHRWRDRRVEPNAENSFGAAAVDSNAAAICVLISTLAQVVTACECPYGQNIRTNELRQS
jgi:hypothetical protein